ncbi:putative late blight resistance protein homolog R1B-16 [Salvia miltiorrhiza]|uniref:putative late blight resistance protein homolog R1B-16 n=1 Tax=Salvia miltiorrhiza TaxID=226208 RepID=UPI0025AD16EB|nr:putative late blight resistance protein homolog R1B-16 [Salvia miltiorrhiza]
MAYEAFDTLLQTLDRILKQGDDRVITHSVKQEILSIRVQAVVLQLNLKHYPNKERIREAAVSTHEIIEYLFSEENLSDRVRLANRLRKLAERLESTVGDVVDCIKGKGSVGSVTDSADVSSSSRSAITSSKDDGVVGLEEDVEVIKNRLLERSSRLRVLPIVGTGGIGRRYLIVMDDMWSKKAWDDVRMLFPDSGNGSWIIVTTRLHDVAAYVDSSSSIHTMSVLDAHHSWNSLEQKVFAGTYFPIELKDIGKKIVQNCGGLPLSIVVVAGLLSKVHTRSSWEQIAANDGQLESIIGSSYTHLPNHLKPCLLYMAGFPEDQEIRVTELVNLWMSEGFVTLSNGSKSLEEEAEDCFEDLVERSLVLVANRKFDGKIKSCSLHDIVREFCIRQAAKEKVILPVIDYLPTPILRRHFVPRLIKDHHSISTTSYDLLHLKDSVHSSHIRTIICIPKKGFRSVGIVEKFSSLRVLHVLRRSDYWDWEPGQVFDLVHLTYLASNIPNNIVPSAILKLHNLQILIIYRSEVRLPVEIWRLRQLRHLIAFSFQPLPSPEWEQNPLDNLQALSLATDLVCSKRMVEMIPNVKKLGICYSKGKFDANAGYCLDNLNLFCQLEKLKLEMSVGFLSRQLVETGGLNFPLQLRRLILSGGKLPWNDMTTIGSLPNLQVLKLRNYACKGSYWMTIEGNFRELRLLLIDRSGLVDWITEGSHFPRLECLILRRCRVLYRIPRNIGYIPTLKLIEVEKWHMRSLLSSAALIEKMQRNSGNDSFQVRVKHS